MFMLFPINIYLLYKEGKKFNYVLFISQFLAMILLGTRTSAVGAVLVVIFALTTYIVSTLFNKQKFNILFLKKFLLHTYIFLLLYLLKTVTFFDENNP